MRKNASAAASVCQTRELNCGAGVEKAKKGRRKEKRVRGRKAQQIVKNEEEGE